MRSIILAATAALFLTLPGQSVLAQSAAENGVVAGPRLRGGGGPLGQVSVGDFQIQHVDEFKATRRVAISVFNVAFPHENRFSANLHRRGGGMVFSAQSTMHTVMSGLDHATEQRIADAAYANFVADLTAAGYEVVPQLAALTPEYATWTPMPNFSEGRYGTYVAPTGRPLHFLIADASKRDSSGQLGQMGLMFRNVNRPQAYTRSPYLARDGNVGIIAVTLVVDYGVYSTSGESRRVKAGSTTGFLAGVAIQSGTLLDTGTLLEYWGPKSGGFPAIAALAVPIRSDDPVGTVVDGTGDIDSVMTVDPVPFERVANRLVRDANLKLVAAMGTTR